MRYPNPIMTLIIATSLLPLGMITILAIAYDAAIIPYIVRDVTSIGKLHPFAGFISNLGAFLWFGAAVITLFAALLARRGELLGHASFLRWGCALSLYLWLDDFFLVHEKLAPDYLGVTEKYIFLALAILMAAYLFFFRRIVLSQNISLLACALFFLSLSVGWDVILSWSWIDETPWMFLLEDGTKWIGIVCWAAYQIDASYRIVQLTQPSRDQLSKGA